MADQLDVLLGDLSYIRSELARNEDTGEKRFGFFVTLATAVSAGLIALATSSNATAKAIADEAIAAGLAALLVFGLLTFLRLLHRNNFTDDLKVMSDAAHARAIKLCKLDPELDKLEWPKKRGVAKLARAGYAEIVGLVDGVLFGAFLRFVMEVQVSSAVVGRVVVAGVLWVISLIRR